MAYLLRNRLLAGLLLLAAFPTHAWVLGHHGGLVTDCTDPSFFDESPGKDARVARMEKFVFTGSTNTDPSTIKVWVNNTQLPTERLTITQEKSGYVNVEGRLPEPVTQGRVWIKVTASSHDGCDQIHAWNVYTGQ